MPSPCSTLRRLPLMLVVFILPAVLLVACDRGPKAPATATLDQPAPPFTLTDIDGRQWSLTALRGKVVFVNFWATWCPPCREEMPSMIRLRKKLAGKPFVMLTILVNDDPAKARQFLASLGGSDLPVLIDPNGTYANVYGTTGVPETFIIDKQGILRKKYIGAWPWDSDGALQVLGQYL